MLLRPASPIPHGAGVLVHDNRGHVLLGLQRDGYSSFGGKAEDGETPRATALREFAEETLGVVTPDAAVSARPLVVTTTPRGRAFHLYEARVVDRPGVVERFRATRAVRGSRETRALRWFALHELPGNARLRPAFRADVGAIVAALQLRMADD